MSKKWFIKEGGQVCFKSDNAELNGWGTQSLVDCLNGKEIKIADLEVKLAESENQCRECKHLNKKIELNIKNKLMTENCELQKQLAEQEKERELDNSFWKQECDSLQKTLVEKDKEIEKYRDANIIVVGERSQGKKHLMEIKIKELQNQKALEQLEKVKEFFINIKTPTLGVIRRSEMVMYIDNQINELKEGK